MEAATETKPKKSHVLKIFLLSLFAILWWHCMYSLLDDIYDYLSGGRKTILRILNISTIVLVVFTLYNSPEILDEFR